MVTDVAGVVEDPTPTTLAFGATALAIRGTSQLWLLVCPKLGSRVARVHRNHPSRVYMYRGCAHAHPSRAPAGRIKIQGSPAGPFFFIYSFPLQTPSLHNVQRQNKHAVQSGISQSPEINS